MPLRRITTLALALSATAATLTALPGAAAARTPETLRWKPCAEEQRQPAETPKDAQDAKGGGGAEVPELPPLECATLDVPLDYADPGGRQIEIAVSRLASEKPERRRGCC